ncbi:chemerin-like receptor 1 [Salminus brasiliensis]|uniref:chemerin-like receptor 1 n=1 Tax=Salminus brasiliensis TaxID=930266 RepID=UPI003B82E272
MRGIMIPTPVTERQYQDYMNGSLTNQTMTLQSCTNATCIIFAVANVIIVVLGIAGNALVIWIAGFKVNKSVVSIWYLSLAVSDFLYCSFLPFSVVNAVQKNWVFGRFMCKFRYFMMSLNWFSSIFLLVIISLDRCVLVMFPVWAQNKRTVRKASVITMLAWIVSAALSMPMAAFRDFQLTNSSQKKMCSYKYMNGQQRIAFVTSRFVFGFVIPYLIIVVCYVMIILKLKTSQMANSKKPFKIMMALIVTFLMCWLPYHTFSLMRLNYKRYKHFLPQASNIAFTLANTNSCLNPFLYAFMGKDFKKQCFAIFSKIENAIEEDGRSTIRGTPVNTSGEINLSTNV